MDDKVMYAWQVVGDYSDYAHFTCARQETAEYLRDMMEAREENMWRDTAVTCDVSYDRLKDRLKGGHQEFSIVECEVIL